MRPVQPRVLQILHVALELPAQRADARGLARQEVSVGRRRPTAPFGAGRDVTPALRALGEPDRLGLLDEAQRLPVAHLGDQVAQRGGQALGEPPHRLLRRRPVELEAVRGLHRVADEHQRPSGAKSLRLVEEQADGDQADRRRDLGRRGEQHARGTRAERHQRRLGLAHALGEDQDRLAPAEGGRGRLEHDLVARRPAPDVLAARHGNRPGQPDERPDDRMAEERRLGERDERSGNRRQQQHRVDERVLVIGGHDDRTARGHALRSDHVHAPVEQGEEPARTGRG